MPFAQTAAKPADDEAAEDSTEGGDTVGKTPEEVKALLKARAAAAAGKKKGKGSSSATAAASAESKARAANAKKKKDKSHYNQQPG